MTSDKASPNPPATPFASTPQDAVATPNVVPFRKPPSRAPMPARPPDDPSPPNAA